MESLFRGVKGPAYTFNWDNLRVARLRRKHSPMKLRDEVIAYMIRHQIQPPADLPPRLLDAIREFPCGDLREVGRAVHGGRLSGYWEPDMCTALMDICESLTCSQPAEGDTTLPTMYFCVPSENLFKLEFHPGTRHIVASFFDCVPEEGSIYTQNDIIGQALLLHPTALPYGSDITLLTLMFKGLSLEFTTLLKTAAEGGDGVVGKLRDIVEILTQHKDVLLTYEDRFNIIGAFVSALKQNKENLYGKLELRPITREVWYLARTVLDFDG